MLKIIIGVIVIAALAILVYYRLLVRNLMECENIYEFKKLLGCLLYEMSLVNDDIHEWTRLVKKYRRLVKFMILAKIPNIPTLHSYIFQQVQEESE